MTENRDQSTYRKTDRKRQSRNRHDPAGCAGTLSTEKTDKRDGTHRQQRFTQPYLIAKDLILKSKLKRIAKEEPRKQRKGCHVGPENGKIRQQNKPERKETEVLSGDFLSKGIDTSGVRCFLNHVLQVPCDHQNDRHAKQKTKHGAKHTGFLQVGIAGHDERAPADTRTDGERPDTKRRKPGA